MSDFRLVYESLRRIMIDAAPGALIAADRPGDLVLHTGEIDPRTRKPVWFGAVSIKTSYVAYHLFPLYTTPELGRDMSAGLARRRQGKSCFNFSKVEPELFAELAGLTHSAAGRIVG